MPASPLESEPEELFGVVLPDRAGNSTAKSTRLAGAAASREAALMDVTGCGES